MSQYRKKPIVVDAIQWHALNRHEVLEFIGPAGGHWRAATEFLPEVIVIYTMEGNHNAKLGDWIIKGVKGEFYPCKPDIFAATYEAVE